jgi:hypothetical protein
MPQKKRRHFEKSQHQDATALLKKDNKVKKDNKDAKT